MKTLIMNTNHKLAQVCGEMIERYYLNISHMCLIQCFNNFSFQETIFKFLNIKLVLNLKRLNCKLYSLHHILCSHKISSLKLEFSDPLLGSVIS